MNENHFESLGKSVPYIKLKNKIRPLKFIIDTGGSRSILNTDLCHPKFIKTINPVPIKTLIEKVCCSQLARIPCFKEFNSIEEIEFLILKLKDKYDGIIGSDILHYFNSKIDYPNKCLEINSQKLKIYFSAKNEEEEQILSYNTIV